MLCLEGVEVRVLSAACIWRDSCDWYNHERITPYLDAVA